MEKLKNMKKELLVILIGGIVFLIIGLFMGFLTSANQENKLIRLTESDYPKITMYINQNDYANKKVSITITNGQYTITIG